MMFLTNKMCILLALFIDNSFATTDMINRLDRLITTYLAGVKLTAKYTMSLGRDYPPIEQDVTFWCLKHNRNDLSQTFFNDPDIMSKVNFSKPINFLIHGWMSGLHGGNMYLPFDTKSHSGWMHPTAVDWAHFVDCNVCVVDWSRLANYDYSIAAMRHTKIVSNALVHFMQFLIAYGMNIRQVSIAGHSLGAHIAGFIGQRFKGEIDAIFGLDPAGPGFTLPFDWGAHTRLDPSDAQYVQCIYTSRGTLGTMKDCGHGNFIMNGGFKQPGCLTVMCSHSWAHKYFQDSLNPKNQFHAEQCTDLIALLFKRVLFQRPCSDITDQLGIYSYRIPGRYYIATDSTRPRKH